MLNKLYLFCGLIFLALALSSCTKGMRYEPIITDTKPLAKCENIWIKTESIEIHNDYDLVGKTVFWCGDFIKTTCPTYLEKKLIVEKKACELGATIYTGDVDTDNMDIVMTFKHWRLKK